MLDKILNFLTGPLIRVITPLCNIGAKIFTPAIVGVSVLYEVLQWISVRFFGFKKDLGLFTQLYDIVIQGVGQAAFGWMPEPIQQIMAMVNYLLPVTHGILFTALLCTIYGPAVSLRLIKSFVPTMAS